MNTMRQAHFFPLPSQGNVYTMAILPLANHTNKLLIGCMKRPIYCLEFLENPTSDLIPTAKEVSFTYIPGGAEIISIDAFNKSKTKNDVVIGITIIKNLMEEMGKETYLNIYSEWEESTDFNVESIAQNCLSIQLNFTPYQLTHTNLHTWSHDEIIKDEIVFLVSGSDNKVHTFKENSVLHSYKEVETKDLFPEFSEPRSVVLWMDIYYYEDFTKRLSAFGCECGYLRVVLICCKTNIKLFNFSTKFMSSISKVQIYPEMVAARKPSFILDEDSDDDRNELNLAVVNTILPAVLFKDVTNCGLKNYTTLKRTEMIRVNTCMAVADLDLDGVCEIIIGNSDEDLKLYRIEDGEAKLRDIKDLVSPVLSMLHVDVIGDGIKELVVMTMKGIYIFQHDPEYVRQVLQSKVEALTIPEMNDPVPT